MPTEGMEERSRRLDSDADAVQVVTIHRSKGLEFPVVYVPFAWDQFQPTVDRPRYHDSAGQRVLDVGSGLAGSDPAAFNAGVKRHQLEEAGRAASVALRRAHQGPLAGGALVGAGDDIGVCTAHASALRNGRGRRRARAVRDHP